MSAGLPCGLANAYTVTVVPATWIWLCFAPCLAKLTAIFFNKASAWAPCPVTSTTNARAIWLGPG